MLFLVSTIQKTPAPPEAGLPLMDALMEWAMANKESGKFREVWGFAGLPGGCAIANVDTLDELDEVVMSFPLAPFSELTITPLVDLAKSVATSKNIQTAMMEKMGKG